MDRNIKIRIASVEDAKEIRAVYLPYVEKTAITFEYETPSTEELASRIEKTLRKYPYLVAVKDGEIWGYAYTGPFVGRAAYAWAAEVSIYLREDKRRQGLGRTLYEAVEAVSRAQGILNLNACIGYPEKEDEYLNGNSVQFHSHMGYRLVGEFRQCGCKFGRWYNMVWMEKIIGTHLPNPAPVTAFPDLNAEALRKIGLAGCRLHPDEDRSGTW